MPQRGRRFLRPLFSFLLPVRMTERVPIFQDEIDAIRGQEGEGGMDDSEVE